MANIATAAAIAIGLPMWIRAVVGPPAPPADLDFRHVDILLYIAGGGSPRRRFATRRAGAASAPPRIDCHDTPDAESSGAAHDGRGRPDLVRVLSARRAQEYRSGCLSVTSDDAARYVHAPCRSRGVRMPGHAHGLRRVGTRPAAPLRLSSSRRRNAGTASESPSCCRTSLPIRSPSTRCCAPG